MSIHFADSKIAYLWTKLYSYFYLFILGKSNVKNKKKKKKEKVWLMILTHF